jgi:hypothetical protein
MQHQKLPWGRVDEGELDVFSPMNSNLPDLSLFLVVCVCWVVEGGSLPTADFNILGEGFLSVDAYSYHLHFARQLQAL